MEICLLRRLLAKLLSVLLSLCTFSLGFNLNMFSDAVSCGLLLLTVKYVTY